MGYDTDWNGEPNWCKLVNCKNHPGFQTVLFFQPATFVFWAVGMSCSVVVVVVVVVVDTQQLQQLQQLQLPTCESASVQPCSAHITAAKFSGQIWRADLKGITSRQVVAGVVFLVKPEVGTWETAAAKHRENREKRRIDVGYLIVMCFCWGTVLKFRLLPPFSTWWSICHLS